jgi:hypothetical protein
MKTREYKKCAPWLLFASANALDLFSTPRTLRASKNERTPNISADPERERIPRRFNPLAG